MTVKWKYMLYWAHCYNGLGEQRLHKQVIIRERCVVALERKRKLYKQQSLSLSVSNASGSQEQDNLSLKISLQ